MANTQVTLSLPVLRKGDKSGPVLRLQQMLNPFVGHGEEGSDIEPLVEDGIFGPKTEDAVRRFQRFSEGPPLAVDGIVGHNTWTRLLTMWMSGQEPG